jgi:hypothetical protein
MTIENALWNMPLLLFWYAAAVLWSMIDGVMLMVGGQFKGAFEFLFGAVSIGAFVASVWLGIRHRSWRLFWLLPPLLLPFVFVFVTSLVAGDGFPPPTVPDGEIRALDRGAIALEVLALLVMVWRMRRDRAVAASATVFYATFGAVALWLGNAALTHLYL